ncbi:MAG: sugar ABC transporter ATP-binding protein [Acidobacteria bacterium]|nr:sugar ABC transporter ATP-binding protein [Acidobacteriota bacterium]
MSANTPWLRMTGIEKRFGGVVALAGVDLEVKAGEVHALVGENGAGKSTLMKILSGALHADRGTIELAGSAYVPSGPVDAAGRGVGMIYQELNLAPHLSVEQNIALGAEPATAGFVRGGLMRRRAESVLERLGHPELRPWTRVAELGPGLRQVVEIAKALVAEARLVVMDEPTSSLSLADTGRLFEVIRRLRSDGVAVIYISHFLEEVAEIADRFTVLRDGRAVTRGRVADTAVEAMVEAMVGSEVGELFPRFDSAPGDVVLDLRRVAGEHLPRSASLELRRGEILGLAGLVGAGRTELLRAIYGLDSLQSGELRVLGAPRTTRRSPAASLAEGMGMLSEDRRGEGLALNLPVAINVTLSRLARYTRGGLLRRGAQARATVRWRERLGIRWRGPWGRTGDLSGGNQQKVALARLLHDDVDVLLLDEPTRGIDVGSRFQIYRLLRRLTGEGKAILLVSSYLPELLGICDRVAVMHRGRLGPARLASEWTLQSLLQAAAVGEMLPEPDSKTGGPSI